MTLNEIAIQLAAPLGRQFDQPLLAMIKDKVVYWTERIIRNSLEKNPRDRVFFKQTVYLPLTESNADCGGTSCSVMATENLPLPLRANSILFDFVGSQDGSTPFKLVSEGFEQFWKDNKYASRYLTYRWTGKRIEVLANKRPEVIKVVAIWPDPRALSGVLCGQGTNCFPDDQEYMVSGDILQLVIQYVNDIDLKDYRPQSSQTEVSIDNDAAVPSNRS